GDIEKQAGGEGGGRKLLWFGWFWIEIASLYPAIAFIIWRLLVLWDERVLSPNYECRASPYRKKQAGRSL
ncbi:hypothetical protein, partial [Eisenbergiella porci]|uniref:hypothetical protein n=1 Tax=Eisenbergiella porci TaxID=2652274 RepID=UPI003AB35C6E